MIPRRHAGFMGHLLPTFGFTLIAKLMRAVNISVTTFSPHSFNPDHLGSGCHHFSAKVLIKVIRDYISSKFVTMLSPPTSQPHSNN